MANPQVQLLIYGHDISYNKLRVDYSGVTIVNTETVDNPNYLFVTLNIKPPAKPGSLQLQFTHKQTGESFEYNYELKGRETNSAQRQG